MFLGLGVVAALFQRESTGAGQVIDAAIVDGVACLMSVFYGMAAAGQFDVKSRGSHYFDGGSHFYEVYECADGEYVSVGAAEPKFYRQLCAILEIDDVEIVTGQHDRDRWPQYKREFARRFRSKTRDEWVEAFAGAETCFAPVLRLDEAPTHPHHQARNTFATVDGIVQPVAAPRFSGSSIPGPGSPVLPGQHTVNVLEELGFDAGEIETLIEAGVARDRTTN